MTNRYHIKWLLLTLALLTLALPALGEDAPIYTTSVALSENTAPIGFRVYATAEGDPIYMEAMLYRLDYDLPDGTPANDPLYFSSFDAGDMQNKLHFVDLNCDGYLDIEALRALGASGLEATYFIYHPADGRFVEEPELTKLTVYQIYPKQKLLVSYAHDSAATGVYAMFRWSEDGYTPYLYRVASFLGDGRPDSTTCRDYVAEYDPSGAKV